MKNLIFYKYQGNGNDFIIIDSRNSDIYNNFISKKLFNVEDLCDRNFGIGADGIIFILDPIGKNDSKMVIFNSDGSEAEMCGNGIRCLIEYLNIDNINKNDNYKIETKAGVKLAQYSNGKISVSMGQPVLDPKSIPTKINKFTNNIPYSHFNVNEFSSLGYAVGMGNPHLIFFVDNLKKIKHVEIGMILEEDYLFPEKTNVHFCQIIDLQNIDVKVWERGAGETLACGTGACAVHVAAHKLGLCKEQTTINLPGGPLTIKWDGTDKEVIMTGNAKQIFKGNYLLD